jgi:hypothetical protein
VGTHPAAVRDHRVRGGRQEDHRPPAGRRQAELRARARRRRGRSWPAACAVRNAKLRGPGLDGGLRGPQREASRTGLAGTLDTCRNPPAALP